MKNVFQGVFARRTAWGAIRIVAMALVLVSLIPFPARAALPIVLEEDEEIGIPAPREQRLGAIPFLDLLRRLSEDPTQGTVEQAVGFYSEGSLVSASVLPPEGPGYVKLFVSRDRHWGTFDMVRVIEIAAASIRDGFPAGERLQVGDIGLVDGGRVSGHASHQNGLDVDFAYYRVDRLEQDAAIDGFEEDFVRGGTLTTNFDLERNWALIKSLHDTGRINRVFVDEAIKSAFCRRAQEGDEYESRVETLRRLRPWRNHSNHLHVRLTCPLSSPRCVPQQEPPEGSGC